MSNMVNIFITDPVFDLDYGIIRSLVFYWTVISKSHLICEFRHTPKMRNKASLYKVYKWIILIDIKTKPSGWDRNI